MRILHVNKFLYRRGGAEGYMLDLAELQVRAGHEVAFYGMDHPENPPRPYQAYFAPRVVLEPPPSGIAKRTATAANMIYSPAGRRGIDPEELTRD